MATVHPDQFLGVTQPGPAAKMLGLLVRHRGVVSREFAFRVIYGGRPESEQPASMGIIDTHVCRLRRALKPHGIKIATYKGLGYIISSPDRTRYLRLSA